MSDLPTQGRLQQMHARSVSGEELEVLGKTAASKYLDGHCRTLTDAVILTVKQATLSPEQVKRVVEFANTDAFLREFKKEGSGHRVIEFIGGPADPSEVIKDLNDGGGGTVFDRGILDYHSPPSETKTASARVEGELASLFEVPESNIPFAEPLADSMDMRDKLAAIVDNLTSELSGLDTVFADLTDRVYFQVKQAAMDGHPLGHISEVMSMGAQDPVIMKLAFQMITPRLLEERVFTSLDKALASMDKTASAVIVNKNHPLVSDMRELSECLHKSAHLRLVRDQANEAYGQITYFLKNANSAAEGAIPKALKFVNDKAHKAAPHIANAAGKAKKHLLGGTGEATKKTVEKVVKHAPEAVGLGLAAEGARRLVNDPTVRKTYHGAQAHLNPMSQDWQVETLRQRGEI